MWIVTSSSMSAMFSVKSLCLRLQIDLSGMILRVVRCMTLSSHNY